MATLNEIENFLQIEIGDKRLRPGKKRENKNRYYYYNDLYYIVELTQGKWMICSDNRDTRRLLRDYCWHYSGCYATAHIQGTTKKCFHQLYLNYEEGLVCDHANRHTFDNRSDNLRIVTYTQNNRNKSTHANNKSGKTGVYRETKRENEPYWTAIITDNEGKRIRRSFNINKLGDGEAYARAVQSRRGMEVLFGYTDD
jgi:hypothetical protein